MNPECNRKLNNFLDKNHDCRFQETDRTGLYIMVFMIFINVVFGGWMDKRDVRKIVREELSKLPSYPVERVVETNTLVNLDIVIEREL
jgi:hypothetical protein